MSAFDPVDYLHCFADERSNPGTGAPYSCELDRYEPRCVSCHIRFDRAARKASA